MSNCGPLKAVDVIFSIQFIASRYVRYVENSIAGGGVSKLSSVSIHRYLLVDICVGRGPQVSAVSRGVESNSSVFSVPTRPLAPVVESAVPGEAELRLTWRSDVNSRQDSYELRYRRRAPPAAPPEPYRKVPAGRHRPSWRTGVSRTSPYTRDDECLRIPLEKTSFSSIR